MKLKAYSHNNPLKHSVLHTIKRNLWLPFVMLALSVILFVVTELVMENRMISSIVNHESDVMFAFNNAEIWGSFPLFLIALAFFSAYVMFSFLFKEKSSSMMLLTGISRNELFLTRYTFGLLSTLIPVLLSMLVMLSFGAGNVYSSFVFDKNAFMLLSMVAMLVICSYTVTVVAIVLCGRKLEFFAVYAVLMLGGIAFLLFIGLLFNAFVHGFAYPIRAEEVNFGFSDMFDKYSWVSLHSVFKDAFIDYTSLGFNAEYNFFDIYSNRLILFSLITVALIPLSALLFKKRNAEHDGKFNANKILSAVCSVIPALTISSFAFVAGGSLPNAIIALAVFTVTAMLFYAFFNGTVRGIFKSVKFICPVTAVFALFILVLNFDIIGYSKMVPEIDDVESVVVSYKGKNDSGFSGSRSGTNCHIVSSLPSMQALPALTSKEDIQIALDIHRKIIADGSMIPSEHTQENYSDTAVYVDYNIVYKLKNGREVIRSYSVMKLSTLYSTLQIEKTNAYLDYFEEQISAGFEKAFYDENGELIVNYDSITVSASDNMLSNTKPLDFSNEDKKKLLQAIKSDKLNETVEQAYHPEEDCIGVLWFHEPNPFSDATLGNPNYVPVYKNDKNILSFLESKSMSGVFDGDYEIKSVKLYSYNYYGRDEVKRMAIDRTFMSFYNYNYFSVSSIYSETSNIFYYLGEVPKEEWEDVLNNSYLVYFRDVGNKYALVTMINSEGEERVVTKFIPE